MTAEKIANRIFDDILNNYSSLEDVKDYLNKYANYHLEKYREYLLQEGDKYTTDYPINQKVTTLIININKLNSYNIK